MAGIFEEAARVARRAADSVLCSVGGLVRITNDITGKVDPLYRESPLDRLRDRVADSLNRYCPVPGGPLPDPVNPPFEGGQCPGVPYLLQYTFNGEPGTDQRPLRGPITSAGNFPQASGQGLCRVRFTGTNSSGQEQTITAVAGACESIGFVGLVRQDGLPDTCGDPPPVPPPGQPPPTDPRPPGTVVNIDLPDIGPIDVTFSPIVGIVYVGVNNSINVPVTVNIDLGGFAPSFDIDFNIDLTNPGADPVPLPPKTPRNPDGRPEIPDCPPPAECRPSPEEEEPEGPIDEQPDNGGGQEVIGLVVRTTDITPRARATQIGQAKNPDIYAPALGFVNFGYRTSDGALVWSPDIAVKNTAFVVGAPRTGLRCVAGEGTPNPGVSWNLTVIEGPRGCS